MTMPKILLFDIEVTPNLVFLWHPRVYSGYVSPDNIFKERVISCIAWKWLWSDRIYSSRFNIDDQNDKKCVKKFLKSWAKADAVITQNGDEFDVKWVRGRAAVHNLNVMSEPLQIDTKKIAKKAFNLNGYGLDYMGKHFNIGEKIETNFSLWKRVFAGQKNALQEQVRYCKQDVRLLEGLFLRSYKWEPRMRAKVKDLYRQAGLL
jgi:uncharacterized protein YprB with RNaseH-like and TPR domain